MGRVELPRVSPLDPKSYLTVVFPAFLGTFEPENTKQDQVGQCYGKVARQVYGTGHNFLNPSDPRLRNRVKEGETHDQAVYDTSRGSRSAREIPRDRSPVGGQWPNTGRQDRSILGVRN